MLTVTPGFLQPLTPENAALGANGQSTVTGYLAEAGGYDGINFALSNAATGSSGGQGYAGLDQLPAQQQAFTSCTVTYTAPLGDRSHRRHLRCGHCRQHRRPGPAPKCC